MDCTRTERLTSAASTCEQIKFQPPPGIEVAPAISLRGQCELEATDPFSHIVGSLAGNGRCGDRRTAHLLFDAWCRRNSPSTVANRQSHFSVADRFHAGDGNSSALPVFAREYRRTLDSYDAQSQPHDRLRAVRRTARLRRCVDKDRSLVKRRRDNGRHPANRSWGRSDAVQRGDFGPNDGLRPSRALDFQRRNHRRSRTSWRQFRCDFDRSAD
jgi:hypothetical protein